VMSASSMTYAAIGQYKSVKASHLRTDGRPERQLTNFSRLYIAQNSQLR
jgi:hypothetical protein